MGVKGCNQRTIQGWVCLFVRTKRYITVRNMFRVRNQKHTSSSTRVRPILTACNLLAKCIHEQSIGVCKYGFEKRMGSQGIAHTVIILFKLWTGKGVITWSIWLFLTVIKSASNQMLSLMSNNGSTWFKRNYDYKSVMNCLRNGACALISVTDPCIKK